MKSEKRSLNVQAIKKLLIENVVNSTLIGGIRATIGTTVYDGSVANELTQLEKSFHKQ